jgi:hypothetical protein
MNWIPVEILGSKSLRNCLEEWLKYPYIFSGGDKKMSKEPKLVYLAGAIEHAPDGGRAWREEMSGFLDESLGHRVFNPCIEENHILTEEEFRMFRNWKAGDLTRFRRTMRKLIDTDLDTLMNKVDYVVCLWDEHVLNGGGTHGELTVAYFHNIPVYMVSKISPAKMSSWILGCTTEVFESFEELKTFLETKFQA